MTGRTISMKLAMAPSFMGRIATMFSGVRPNASLASLSTGQYFVVDLVDS
jgi:hypothetical protein